MSDFRIIDENFLFDSSVGISASTTDVNFPVTNFTQTIRSKVWRSNLTGQFIIDSTNNKIDFKESGGGGELTATLTSATFNATTLAAEIKTQLEVAGAETYTVTYSTTTGKWTVSTSGAFLSILWSSGTNTASSTGPSIGFNVDSTGAITYTGIKAIHTEEEVVIDLKTSEAIDSFAIVFDPFLGVQLSESSTLKLQANATDEWSSPSVDVSLVIDQQNLVATHFFTSDQEFRFWRVQIIDPQNPNLQVELPKLVLAKKLLITQNPGVGFTYNQTDASTIQRTQFGHIYADVFPVAKGFVFNFEAIDFNDVKLLAQSFERVGITEIVCIAIDAGEVLFDKDRFFIYGRYREVAEYTQRATEFFDRGLAIGEDF